MVNMDRFMKTALEQAVQSRDEHGIPIGSVLVRDWQILGVGYNRRVQDDDPVAHAEIDCLRNAGRIGSYRDTVLYSTLMPCHLCAGAVVQFGIPKVIVGESENFQGAEQWLTSQGVEVINLDLEECKTLMRTFIHQHPEIWSEDIGE